MTHGKPTFAPAEPKQVPRRNHTGMHPAEREPGLWLEHCIDRPGVLLDECSAAGKLRQLEQAIHELPLTEGVDNVEIKTASTVAAHGDLGGRSGAFGWRGIACANQA